MKLGIICDLFENPSRAFDEVMFERPVFASIVFFAAGTFSYFLSYFIIHPQGPGLVAAVLFFFILVFFAVWVFGSAFFHLMSEALSGKGSSLSLFVLFGFTFLPLILCLPLAICSTFFGVEHLKTIMEYAVFIWIVRLQVLALEKVYAFPKRKALAVWCLPVVIGIVALLAIVFGGGIFVLGECLRKFT